MGKIEYEKTNNNRFDGIGRAIYNHAMECIGSGSDYEIKGFIDNNISALDGFEGNPSIISTINDYKLLRDDVFVNSLWGVVQKKLHNKYPL